MNDVSMTDIDLKWIVFYGVLLILLFSVDGFREAPDAVPESASAGETADGARRPTTAKVRRGMAASAIGDGRISVYDSLFVKYAADAGWDWRLIASIAYQESKFINGLSSGKGAKGLMGIMPATAEMLSLPEDSIFHPESNLRAAVNLIKRLNRSFSGIPDVDERRKFIVAAYNAGAGHVNDARALAAKYGMDAARWDDAAEFMKRLYDPSYYGDSVCRAGTFRACQTLDYVESVFERWEFYKTVALCLEKD
jgi:membrane-bound lytic murein transglycosylase F